MQMKKRVSALFLALALIFSISAAAATPRAKNPFTHSERITASSRGVTCVVDISSDSVKLTASGTVSLYKDGGFLKTRTVNSLYFSVTYTPGGKGTYRMDYNIIVKGPNGSDSLSGSKSDTY